MLVSELRARLEDMRPDATVWIVIPDDGSHKDYTSELEMTHKEEHTIHLIGN